MLSPLEKAVLEMMLEKPNEHIEVIRQQLAHAQVGRREFTGVGFFTRFLIPSDATVRRDLPNMEIRNVAAEFPGMQHGAGFVLFIRDGVISMLEGFTYDEPWPEQTDKFSLKRSGAT
jgi:hypothetical protein